MDPQPPRFQDLPICVRPLRLNSYFDHSVAVLPGTGATVFLDEEERELTGCLASPISLSGLIQEYHTRYRKYSYKKVFQLVSRLLENGFLTPSSEQILLASPDFRASAPRPARAPRIAMGNWLPRNLPRLTIDHPVLIGVLVCLTGAVGFRLWSDGSMREYFSVGGRLSIGVCVWMLSLTVIRFLKLMVKVIVLRTRGMDIPHAGWGRPGGGFTFWISDGQILSCGPAAVLRYHLFCIFLPAAWAAIALAVDSRWPCPATGMWCLACLLTIFLDLSPLFRSDLAQLLDRLSGRGHLGLGLRTFVRKKFVTRTISFGSTFEGEGALLGYGIYSLFWILWAYQFTGFAMSRKLGPLSDVAVRTDLWTERGAAVVFLFATGLPFFTILVTALRLAAANLFSLFERPIARWMSRFLRPDVRKLSVDAIVGFLRAIPLFSNVSPSALTDLSASFQIRLYRRGETVVWQGEIGQEFFVICEGEVDVIHESPDGSQTRLSVLRAGDSFGEIALLNDIPRTANVCASSTLVCLVLHKDAFIPFVRTRARDSQEITRLIQLSAFLKTSPLFEDLPPETMNRVLAGICAEESYPAGAPVIREGESADRFYILRTGRMDVWKDYDRPSARKIAELQAGDHFGEIALLEESGRTATVVAAVPSLVLSLTRDVFHRLMEDNALKSVSIEETARLRRKMADHRS